MIKKTIIIVPIYNESKRFEPNAFMNFCEQTPHVHFLFVDDASMDDSTAKIQRLMSQNPKFFSLLELPCNMGKAEAVRNGMLKAFQSQPDFIGFWDADLSTPLNEIPRFLDILNNDPAVHLVTGARIRLLGRDIQRNHLRHYVGRISATLISLVLGIHSYDTQCGAKIFRTTKTVQSLFYVPFKSKWIFDVEILARLLTCARTDANYHPGRCVYEIPLLQWIDKPGSKVKGKDYLHALHDLLEIRRGLQQ